jgi:MFS family permease
LTKFRALEQAPLKLYAYRWIILMVFMLVVAINQMLWITFAPVTSLAASYYNVSDLSIGLLSMIFMIVYIVVSIPASWIIDTYGIKPGVGIGAVLTGVFGLLRGIYGHDYTWVLIAQIGIATGQPFLLNAITSLAARWFPIQERATATGLSSLAMYLGIMSALMLTPYLSLHFSIGGMLYAYGLAAVVFAVIFLIFFREKPFTPSSQTGQEERSLVLAGFKQSLQNRDFLWLMLVFFIGLGVFNSVTTWIEEILQPRGFTLAQAGMSGGVMIAAGIMGAIILPLLSDRYQKRIPFIVIALAGSIAGLAGITFSGNMPILITSSFMMGFFLLSAGPIGFQYAAEITYPASEGISNGLLIMMGQISGILFIFGMDALKAPGTHAMTLPLVILIGLMLFGLLISTRLRESGMIR